MSAYANAEFALADLKYAPTRADVIHALGIHEYSRTCSRRM
jgi:hypothetical protein